MVEIMDKNAKTTQNDYGNQLKRGLSMVENKERALNSKKLINENKLKEIKGRFVKQAFAILREAGVDPSNLESINEFLSGLAEQDPDLLALFEAAFGGLLGDVEGPQMQEQVDNSPIIPSVKKNVLDSNFNNLKNISSSIL